MCGGVCVCVHVFAVQIWLRNEMVVEPRNCGCGMMGCTGGAWCPGSPL